jgi:hypothetical protein
VDRWRNLAGRLGLWTTVNGNSSELGEAAAMLCQVNAEAGDALGGHGDDSDYNDDDVAKEIFESKPLIKSNSYNETTSR